MAARKPTIRKKVEGAYHHGDLKAVLKKAALRLVREKGPRGFSLNEASRLAGVTVAAPYRHFTDKDALLAEVGCDGNELMAKEIREAVEMVGDVREKMLEAGMAYLKFASQHPDYFAVIFYAGLDKTKYPEFARTAKESFSIIWELSRQFEKSPELAAGRAVSAWALVHGLATLRVDGALSTAMGAGTGAEHLRPLLRQFLGEPFRAENAEASAAHERVLPRPR